MKLFTVKNASGSIVESVIADSHAEAVKKAAGKKLNDSRYTWQSVCHGDIKKVKPC